MSLPRASLIALMILSTLVSCRALDAHTVRRRIVVDGLERTYLLHVPPNVATPAPVVLCFHGGGADDISAETGCGFSELSHRDGFILIYPQGHGRHWHDGRDDECSHTRRGAVDDLAFVEAVLDAVAREHPLDENRVFATGISNGGFMSHYVGANLSTRIAAIAPVVGGMADPFHKQFKPVRPVSVLIIQGTADPLIPYGGGAVARNRGRMIPTREAARLWVEHNGCGPQAVRDSVEDRDPDDGCRVTRETWTGGKEGAEVVLLTIEGGGHTWPGGPQYLPKAIIGPVCRDFNASLIWEFFKAHARH
jgi:polyhydroxybutyrate depolymerase